MFHTYILFKDPLTTGKYSQLVEQIDRSLETKKLIHIDQLKKIEEQESKILITDEETYDSIKEYFDSFELLIFVGENEKKESEQIYFIQQKFIITQLRTVLTAYIKTKLGILEYVPLSIKLFKPEVAYPCDLFIKINTEKYLKIGKADSLMDEKVLQKLVFKGSKYLYLQKENYTKLIEFIKPNQEAETQDKQVDVNVKAVETVHDYITDMGVDKKIINMAKGIQNNIEEKFDQKFMRALFQHFKNMEGSFLYNHSYLTATLALSVGQKFTWMNPENNEKIFLASILHDLGHKKEEYAKFEGLSKVGLDTLDDEVREAILKHPTVFAQKLAQVPDIHQDVLKIVKDHHGVKGESSYPKQIYPTEINLIFALFILSHEFSLKLYSIAFNPKKIPKALEDVIAEFNKGHYKKIIPEFKETIEQTFLK